ncbi:hypothetical protein R3P38DRAFT_2803766 [Favolaschia claudopus]|uniref:Uncharacterized protein n=1 Tax=Favolaschia claudopus TaxID=2862362 RepID=A0AAV9ZRD8_9AGAR
MFFPHHLTHVSCLLRLISGELPMKSLLTYVAKNRGALSHTIPPPPMASKRGRPAKKSKRNTSGLENQDPEELSDYGDKEMPNDLELDSIVYLEVDTDYDDVYDEDDWEQIATAKFKERLLEMVVKEEEDKRDAGDSDWLPSQERYEAERKVRIRKPGGMKILLS